MLKKFHIPYIVIQRKKAIFWALAIFLGTSIYFYNIRRRQKILKTKSTQITKKYPEMEHFRMQGIKDFRIKETEEFLINTPGCFIQNYAKSFSYVYNLPMYKPSAMSRCGTRAVFIHTLDDNKVKIRINRKELTKYSKHFNCCYKFVNKSIDPEQESDYLSYTTCKVFPDNGTMALDHEIIIVECYERNQNTKRLRKIIYEDAYIKIKKIHKDNTQLKTDNRVDWIGHQGTFSHLLPILTGMKMSTIDSKCKSGFIKCADFFIWKKYKDAGYYTAYGEDYLQLPDVFYKYKGFKGRPTDHCMRQFYLTGEKRLGHSKILCTKKMPSATHLLEYALNFVDSYKNNNTFGFFWINSYTNSILNNPSLIDAEIVNFFEKLNNTEVFNNTFVIFFSDQGTSYGDMRIPKESYYDERLPMLFIWTPFEFRRQYINEYYNLKFNEGRLISPYDLYVTLSDVLRKSMNSSNVSLSEACPQCTSLFDRKALYRTCADAGVNEVWCSCHNMTEAETDDDVFDKQLKLLTAHINNRTYFVETVPCMTCMPLNLFSVWRSHQYQDGNKTYHVILFIMVPGRLIFEAVLENFTVLYISSISGYNNKGNCALNPDDRPYCVCTLNGNCTV